MDNFQQILDNYARCFGANFVIAFSGGGDSMALLALCREWQLARQSQGFDVNINACIIDHGIAANSANVAQAAFVAAQKLGVNAVIAKVSTKIATKIQENARKLRYELLVGYAHEIGAKIILLAHNKDDQIETILFRMSRATGLDGMVGMRELRPITNANDIFLARPLLGASRTQLREFLRKSNIQFYDDPANINTQFSRVKIRKSTPVLTANGFDGGKLLRIANLANTLRTRLDGQAIIYLATHLKEVNNQFILLHEFGSALNLFQKRAIGALIFAISGKNYGINAEKLDDLCSKLASKGFKSATLANVQIKRSAGNLKFMPAPPRGKTGKNSDFDSFKAIEKLNHALWHTSHADNTSKTGQYLA